MLLVPCILPIIYFMFIFHILMVSILWFMKHGYNLLYTKLLQISSTKVPNALKPCSIDHCCSFLPSFPPLFPLLGNLSFFENILMTKKNETMLAIKKKQLLPSHSHSRDVLFWKAIFQGCRAPVTKVYLLFVLEVIMNSFSYYFPDKQQKCFKIFAESYEMKHFL